MNMNNFRFVRIIIVSTIIAILCGCVNTHPQYAAHHESYQDSQQRQAEGSAMMAYFGQMAQSTNPNAWGSVSESIPVAVQAYKAKTNQQPFVEPVHYVAENGSYYGEVSTKTGRPKTVPVRGYYRKDGTYVRGHYRSPPRTKRNSK